ncbi:hypothetical protein DESC_970039 [Desulfosarcina cetonica]|nr:hypothetical protein DESC_970039 [Desulfosarcina cetonica]
MGSLDASKTEEALHMRWFGKKKTLTGLARTCG